MISIRGYTCRPAEKRAELNRSPATQSPASRPLAPRPASVVKPPSPVRDSARTGNPGDLQDLSDALNSFHGCLVGRSSPGERLMQALSMMDMLRKVSALLLPGLAALWEQARAAHRAALLEMVGPAAEQIIALSAPTFVSPFVSPASSLPAIPASPVPAPPSQASALQPPAPASLALAPPVPALQSPASPAPPVPALQPPDPASTAPPVRALQFSASPAPVL